MQSALANKVDLKVYNVDLSHKLKTHLDNKGYLKVCVSKGLTDNLKLHLTGLLDVHNITAVRPRNMGLKLEYE